MRDLRQRISELTDDESLGAVDYLANWMKEKANREDILPADYAITNDQAVIDILGQTLPETTDYLKEILMDERKGQIARKLLLFMSENKSYTSKIEEALDRPNLREPLTLSLGSAILIFLILEFDLEYVDIKSGKRFRISKKSPTLELIKELLGR